MSSISMTFINGQQVFSGAPAVMAQFLKSLQDASAKKTIGSEAPKPAPNKGFDRSAWPTDAGPEGKPHPWTVKEARKFRKHVSYPRNYGPMLFEVERGVLTYREIGDLFGYTAPHVFTTAKINGIARHINPRTHKGKTVTGHNPRSMNIS